MTDIKKLLKNKRFITAIILVTTLIAAILSVYLWKSNNTLDISYYTYTSSEIPGSLDGKKALIVSDLHNKRFGKNSSKLISAIKDISADCIFITGDIIDGRRKGFEKTIEFIEAIRGIAPCYYVTGNHDYYLKDDERARIFDSLTKNGIKLLCDEKISLEADGKKINIIGIDDPQPYFIENKEVLVDMPPEEQREALSLYTTKKLQALTENDAFNLVLCHRPDYFPEFSLTQADLILSGHTHGGQIRTPFFEFVRNKVFPDDFSEYIGGMYKENQSQMIVSRGLGNSLFPWRINNNPELVVVSFTNK